MKTRHVFAALQSQTGFAAFLLPLVVTLGFLITMLAFAPISMSFQSNDDEGVELMKAALVQRGYRLYQDIENEQPPLFTLLLAQVIGFAGFSVGAGRVLVAALVGLRHRLTTCGWACTG